MSTLHLYLPLPTTPPPLLLHLKVAVTTSANTVLLLDTNISFTFEVYSILPSLGRLVEGGSGADVRL